ncbi:MAG TPA: CDP-alcohol phosphatidyltransferase family protein [Hyphomicrobiales bacterium]|nr:CDP-alcohol phosphatidyltransferase family protein [Hyphomicrobiales bacterium]
MNIPNLLTISRIFLVPVVVWLIIRGSSLAAFWVFVVAAATDAADGYLARRWRQRTELGAYLDALADKALLVSIYVSLGMAGGIPAWLAIGVVSRDVMIVGAVILSWLLDRPLAIAPLIVSKLNTLVQIVYAAFVLGALGFHVVLGSAVFTALAVMVALLTLVSAAAYLASWMRHMAGWEPPR